MTGYLVAIPYACAVVAMIWWTKRSDMKQERVFHVAAPAIFGGLALIAAAYLTNPFLAGIAVTLCAMGTYAAIPTFWALPTGILTGTAAAAGIALVNSIGNLGGFFGPYMVGWITQHTGTPTLGLVALAGAYIMAGLVTIALGHDRRIEMAGSEAPAA
jgi:nitrate/nitrite transporter NarK